MISWRELHRRMPSFTEAEIWHLLDEEINGPARAAFIERLHQRYCALRANRERMELLNKARRA